MVYTEIKDIEGNFMVKDGKGGAKTLTGLRFEEKVDFLDLLKDITGYTVQKSAKMVGIEVYFND